MAVGGFSGSDDSLDKERLAQLVEDGELRFVTSGAGGISAVVAEACTAVPASTWGGTGTSTTLYDCAGRAAAIRGSAAEVTAGGGPGGFPGGSGGPGGAGGGVSIAELQQCLAKSGVTLPDPASGGRPDPAVMEALQACGVPLGGPGGGAGVPPAGG